VQYTSKISEYVEEFVSGKDVQMALCVYPSKMADWQIKCKNKLLIRNEIKNHSQRNEEQCCQLSLPAPNCLLLSEQPLSAILCWCVIFTVVIVVVYTCVKRYVIVVVCTSIISCVTVVVCTRVIICYCCGVHISYKLYYCGVHMCYKVCYCCGVHMCYEVCYCCGLHMCYKLRYANTLLLLVIITSGRGRTRSRLLLHRAVGYWRRSNSAVVQNIMQSCTLLLMTTQKP
jgi:hypothetical protein